MCLNAVKHEQIAEDSQNVRGHQKTRGGARVVDHEYRKEHLLQEDARRVEDRGERNPTRKRRYDKDTSSGEDR